MRCLKKTLGNAKLCYEELETVIIDIKGILNSRLLTYVYSEITDVYSEITEGPLIPAHLVCSRRLFNLYGVADQEEKSVGKRARYLTNALSDFKSQWKNEYLTALREKTRESLNLNVKVGDIVHIYEQRPPRHVWKIGRIEKLLKGKDAIVRAMELVALDKAGNLIRLKRLLRKLYPLETSTASCGGTAVESYTGKHDEPMITMIRDEDVDMIIEDK